MNSSIFYLHGSPGDETEANVLKTMGIPAKPLARGTAPASSSILIGYSWGAREALDLALSNAAVSGLILISPYLRPKPIGKIVKALLESQKIGEWILRKKSDGIIEEFLFKSCYPLEPTAEYVNYVRSLATPAKLREAVLEKRPLPDDYFTRLRQLRIPALVIHGKQDKTSVFAEQIEPLLQALPRARAEAVDQAGHALTFTHGETVQNLINEFIPQTNIRELV